MKKIIFIMLSISVVCLLLFFIIYGQNQHIVIENTKTKKNIINTNALTMMYETEAGSGEYQVSTDTTWPQDGYIFNETLSKCENGGTLFWNNETNKVIMQSNTSDRCYVYFDVDVNTLADVCSGGEKLAQCIKNFYNTFGEGEDGLYYHDGQGEYGDLEAYYNSYRYSGANPNNYVCFGSDAATCPEDNLYRIIGVFGNQVKLIKNSRLGAAYASSGDWKNNSINMDLLNGTYLESLGNWENFIANTTWNVTYQSSVGNLKNINIVEEPYDFDNILYSAKIGLIYLSDYGYAASPEYWNTHMSQYADSISSNWLSKMINSWTIVSMDENQVYVIDAENNIRNFPILFSGQVIFPAFYLNYSVIYSDGKGSVNNPYRISLEKQDTFNFFIDDKEYTAEAGMTWYDWIVSDYNVDNFYIDFEYNKEPGISNSNVLFGNGERVYDSETLEDVFGGEKIIEGYYTT